MFGLDKKQQLLCESAKEKVTKQLGHELTLIAFASQIETKIDTETAFRIAASAVAVLLVAGRIIIKETKQ